MINAEKYKDRILEVASNNKVFGLDTKTNKIDNCSSIKCRDCLFYTFGTISEHDVNRIKWLLSEYKEPIKVSKLEYDILKYLSDNTRHMYIARNENGVLYIFDVEPVKNKVNNLWTGRGAGWLGAFNKLFQFVQWEDSEPTAIEDVLGNCEVIDDESSK